FGCCGRYFPKENMQRPLCRDSGIELPKASRSSIARIGECLGPKVLLCAIELLELLLIHVDLAAQNQVPRNASALLRAGGKLQWNLTNCSYIRGDIFAAVPIAPC